MFDLALVGALVVFGLVVLGGAWWEVRRARDVVTPLEARRRLMRKS